MYATFVVGLLLVSQVESLCNGGADVIIAIDNSFSMHKTYENILSVLHDTVSGFEIGPGAFQVGVFSFPFSGKCFDLDQFRTRATLLSALKDPLFPPLKHCASILNNGRAIYEMYTTYFSAARGGRAKAKKIGIVVTDGRTGLISTKYYSAIARQKGISLYAIGAGKWQYGQAEISAIGDSPEHVFWLSVSNLTNLVDSLTSRVCGAAADPLFCDQTIAGILNHYVPNSGCSTFQHSVTGHKAVTQPCPASLLFSTKSCRCEYPATVKCGV